jgi:hypothetical protein
LSDWNSDANEAINASTTMRIAKCYKTPQISFIADACRITWNDAQGTTGQVILPKANPSSSDSQVDQFLATAFGDVSQQFEPAQVLASYGVFSKEVLNALEGAAAIARSGKRMVTSRSLEDYLRDAVPKACSRIPNAAVQHPDTNPKWREPKDIYVEVAEPGFLVRGPRKGSRPAPPDEALTKRTDNIKQDAGRYRAAEGRESYETGAGLTVFGAQVEEVVTSGNYATPFFENDAWQVRISGEEHRNREPTKPCTVLLQLSNGTWARHWIAVPVFPRLIGTCLIDDNGFSSLNYRKAFRFRKPSSEPASRDLEGALAEAAAMFRYGLMPSRERVHKMISLMRNRKLDNPALAVIAAHICYRLGDLEQISGMENFEIGQGPYTPYDFLLLLGREKQKRYRKIVGEFPLMSQGWGLLPAAEFNFDRRLLTVIGGLVPSLWTMANPNAGAILADVVVDAARVPA